MRSTVGEMAILNKHDELLSYFLTLSSVAVFLITASIVLLKRNRILGSSSASFALPPSPPSLPIFGHLPLLYGDLPYRKLGKLADRYGPLMYLRLGSFPALLVSSSVAARELFKSHDYAISGRPPSASSQLSGSQGFLFAQFGPLFSAFKKIFVTELLGTKSLERLRHARDGEIGSFITSVVESAISGDKINVSEKLEILASNIVSRVATGKRLERVEELRSVVKESRELTGTFYPGDFFLGFLGKLDLWGYRERLCTVLRRFNDLTEEIVREHEERKKRKSDREDEGDVVDVLLSSGEPNMQEDVELNRNNVKAYLQDVLAGGLEALSLTMQWSVAELLRNPDVLKKAQEEIDSVVGRNFPLVQESDIPNLPYLQAIVKETLRLHPVGPLITRRTMEEFKLGRYNVGANWWVVFNVWAIGRDPTIWDRPLEFRPERFMGSSVDVKGHHFELLPFGSGRRMCPGNLLAMHVMHATIGGLIQCFNWEVDGGPRSIRLEEGRGLTMGMKHPLICRPILRCNPFDAAGTKQMQRSIEI